MSRKLGLDILEDLEYFRKRIESGKVQAASPDWVVRMCQAMVSKACLDNTPRDKWTGEIRDSHDRMVKHLEKNLIERVATYEDRCVIHTKIREITITSQHKVDIIKGILAKGAELGTDPCAFLHRAIVVERVFD